jgi:hypothetical protein
LIEEVLNNNFSYHKLLEREEKEEEVEGRSKELQSPPKLSMFRPRGFNNSTKDRLFFWHIKSTPGVQ